MVRVLTDEDGAPARRIDEAAPKGTAAGLRYPAPFMTSVAP